MSDQPKHGPWTICGLEKRTLIRIGGMEMPATAEEAELRCAELNAAERVRDAAPRLLAACKAALEVIQFPSGKTAEQRNEVLTQLAEAIKSAEGGEG